MSVKTYAKKMAVFAKEQNRIFERFARNYPDYRSWSVELFEQNKERLKLLTGRF